MKVILKMIKKMDLEKKKPLMAPYIQGNLKIIKNMAKELYY